MWRRPGFNIEEFSEYWRTVHKQYAMRMAEIGLTLGYLQNHLIEGDIEGLPRTSDGCAEVWMRSLDNLRSFASSPEYLEGAAVDEERFMAMRPQVLIGREVELVAGPSRIEALHLTKVMLWVKRRPGVSNGDFAKWVDPMWEMAAGARKPQKLLRVTALDSSETRFGDPPYDGLEISWWPDLATFENAWKERRSENMPLIDASATTGLIVREEPVFWPVGIDQI
ncbi:MULTISPECIES: EthD domain-containing protein [unclassified Sphingomonas]|uniref:EthD domain-containing protein n=1 Tax=unclassified Sphingomonas TaxID=196159 RepID=UPI0006FB51F8|nr:MULTISPECIES: EthD domain-containing protein [unclassified Sphingomonas]KQX19138.1 hypothetical protein ASD17_11255 [Sphingomonas sp. Root1294]KQY65339.1 hypothetical protein ASD39_14450 [Sphingomonas sp. Root50]KRB95366.1 hypothetical protein ASE22_05605 [Sphingomonas sp. Root720]